MHHFFSDQEFRYLNFLTEDDFVKSQPRLILNNCNSRFLSDRGLTTVIAFLADSISEQFNTETDSRIVIGVCGSVSSGKSYFSSFSHEENTYIFFSVGQISVLLYKLG